MFFRLLVLVNCKKLNLCTNSIDKIANLNGLKNLVILNLARNNIKNLTGLDAVGDTLEQLWISYNAVEKLKGIQVAKKLKILQITNNKIKVKFMVTKPNGHLARPDSDHQTTHFTQDSYFMFRIGVNFQNLASYQN